MLTGFIQAYIFAVLAMVYIVSATQVQEKKIEQVEQEK
jgi:F-type H+-transporting ATPase subunit a